MTSSILVAFFVVARLAAGVVEQGAGVAKDEALLAELRQLLAKAWVSGDRATIERIIAPDWRTTIRFTDTFVRREGRRQAVASHSSLLAGRP